MFGNIQGFPTAFFLALLFFGHDFWPVDSFYPTSMSFRPTRQTTRITQPRDCETSLAHPPTAKSHRPDKSCRRQNPYSLNMVLSSPESSLDTKEDAEVPASPSSSSLLFDQATWEAYNEIIQEVMVSPRVLKVFKKRQADLESAQAFLLQPPTLTAAATDDDNNDVDNDKHAFMQQYNLTVAQHEYIMHSLVYMGDACAKRQTSGLPIVVAWHKMKQAKIKPRENCISTYMYILSGGTNNDNDDNRHDEIIGEALNQVATFHDAHFQPNEKTISLRIKYLIEQKQNVTQAEDVLKSWELRKLRTFLPILEYYCNASPSSDNDKKNLKYNILRVYQEMQQCPTVYWDSEVYALLVGSLARLGSFGNNEDGVDDRVIQLGFQNSHGPKLLDEVASIMATHILEFSEEAVKLLFDGFQQYFSTGEEESSETSLWDSMRQSESGVSKMNSLSMGSVVIDDATALCPATGTKLRLFKLDEAQRQHVQDTLLEMARIRHQEFTKKSKKKVEEEDINLGFKELSRFKDWLDSREGDPFTVIVDGPNVAYYGHPTVHYSQVKLLVDELEKMGEKPLVTMPQKYTNKSFRVAGDRWQKRTDRDKETIDSLVEQEKMYVVPPRCLDDYYWMLASVSNQTTARCHKDLQVSINDEEGRFPGLRPMIVSNDQMRDHKLDLLEPREFRRWCSCHIVNYTITSVEDEDSDNGATRREVEFFPADFFSREIQGNKAGSGNGIVWHLPVAEWEASDRFFIWIDPTV